MSQSYFYHAEERKAVPGGQQGETEEQGAAQSASPSSVCLLLPVGSGGGEITSLSTVRNYQRSRFIPQRC